MTGAAISIRRKFQAKIEAQLKVSIHQEEVEEEEAQEEELQEAEIIEVDSEEEVGEQGDQMVNMVYNTPEAAMKSMFNKNGTKMASRT